MILAEKPQFSRNFSKKSNKNSPTIVLPWKQWVSHETDMRLKRKLISLYQKSESFSSLPFTVLAQQREKHGCGWISPPGLNRVKNGLLLFATAISFSQRTDDLYDPYCISENQAGRKCTPCISVFIARRY